MKKVILTFSFLLVVVLTVQSHSDMAKIYKFGSVTSSIQWGFYEHEERNKAIIISMLADTLLEYYHFSDKANLGFGHSYMDKSKETFSLSLVSEDNESPRIKIDLESYRYDTEKVLKLLEYAILTMKELKKIENQDTVFTRNYVDGESKKTKSYRVSRISNGLVESALKHPTSELVKSLLSKKMYRPSEDLSKFDNSSISYYIQNDQYHVFHRMVQNGKGYEMDVLKLDNVFQFIPVQVRDRAMVFDSDSSFYFLNYYNAKSVKLSRKIVPYLSIKYYPYQVTFPGQSMVTFSKKDDSKIENSNERYFVYRIEDEYLVTDLNNVIDRTKTQSNN